MPWVFFPSVNITDQFRLPQAMWMDLTFLFIIAMSFIKGNNFVYKNKYFCWLIVWIFGKLAFDFIIPYNIAFTTGRGLNISVLEPMIHIFLGLWAMQIMLANLDRFDFIRIAKAICLSAIAITIFSFFQFIGWNPWGAIKAGYLCDNIVSACLDNPNVVGMYLVLALPLFFMFKEAKYALGLLIVIGGIIITKSHFSIALALFACFAYFALRYRKNIWFISTMIALSIFLGAIVIGQMDFAKIQMNGMSGRLDVWKFGIDRVKENPIFGQGIGIWKNFQYVDNHHTTWYSAHNDWLERLIEIGIIGIFLMVLVIVNAFRRFTYSDENFSFLIMFATFIIMMFGSFPLEVPTIAMLGLVSFIAVEKT